MIMLINYINVLEEINYITRALIVLMDKYKLNQNPKFVYFDTIKNEIENTISIITAKIQIKIIDEI